MATFNEHWAAEKVAKIVEQEARLQAAAIETVCAPLRAENAALRKALQHVTAAGVRFLPDGCPTCRAARQLAEVDRG
jgi:hypothetical protein